jgi:hypothetical protein
MGQLVPWTRDAPLLGGLYTFNRRSKSSDSASVSRRFRW